MERRDVIAIKGSREGLTLRISHKTGAEEALTALRARIDAGPQFFIGARVTVMRPFGWDEGMIAPMAEALQSIGVSEVILGVEPPPTFVEEEPSGRISHIVKGTLRNGQRVSFRGDLIVIGDVNPGAELVSRGNIIVMGYLRGSAHAGARGDAQAFICAFAVQPTDLSIAGIASDRFVSEAPKYPEWARLEGNRVVIEPYLPIRG